MNRRGHTPFYEVKAKETRESCSRPLVATLAIINTLNMPPQKEVPGEQDANESYGKENEKDNDYELVPRQKYLKK